MSTSAVIGFKDQGRTALKGWLARRISGALSRLLAQVPESGQTHLVCLPTSRSALIRRGFDSNRILASRVAKESGLRFLPGALRYSREPRDQRELPLAERVANLQNSMVAIKPPPRVVLVDDVVTTGASMSEAIRALEWAGASVAGVVVFAETLRRT